ncbi:trypsin-like peptidase domain-containing protein [Streptomyces sp. MB09-02B]|nr:trypsin-like peptidase domain-containing protein [Streptomyces sp. MB09-02B]MDX3643493.1 trypsin-like peptidase domain-containing protein [Streptomyces sp. MB09-02B]
MENLGSSANPAREENPEGDFELERPATAAVTTASALAETDSGADFELARPVVEAPSGGASTSTAAAAGDTDGDFELERPTGAGAGRDAADGTSSPTEPGGSAVDADEGRTGGAAASVTAAISASAAPAPAPSAAGVPTTMVVGATATADARPSAEQGAVSAPDAPSERPKPLHDPDPYGTPPYGEPGPWAPAPPFQHPATSPAPGPHVQQTTPVPDAHAVAGAPTPDGTTASGASSSGASSDDGAPSASAVSPTRAGVPAAAAPAYADTTASAPAAHGTAVPATVPGPMPADSHPDAPRPGPAPYQDAVRSAAAPQAAAASYADVPAAAAATSFPDASQPAAAPYPDAPRPPGASYAYPSQPGPPPFGEAAQPVPPPYAGGAQPVPPPYAGGAQAAQPSREAGGQHVSGAYANPGQSPQAAPHSSQGPWQNYDPWAGSGSLQQNGAAVDDVARRRRRRGRTLVVGALLIAVVAGGVGGVVGAYLERNGGVGAIELPQTSDGVTGRAPDSVAGIAASALPSVVTLHVSGDSAQGTGTGFVLDERGHILTNNHVVDPAGADGDISVTFSGGETAKATMVGRDTGYDLAVVKVSGVSGLKPLPLGNSEEVQVGDPVVAIGAPFDLANTVTSGIISAKERPITAGGQSGNVSDVSYVDALQTDAPINPGNSGGPLLDGKARVIGINSAIRSAGSGSESDGGQAGSIGLGFAIPINQGKRVAEELINTGKATHPVIGVTLDMDYSGDGARIGERGDGDGSGVTSGGPADRAGMRSGDVITEVDGQRVHSGDELIVKVRAHRPGDRLELTLLRDGRERTVTLTLGSSGGD